MRNIKMHLNDEPFERIKNGLKKVEYRVNDEKRQSLKIGDKITFFKRTNEKEKIEAIILDLEYFPDLLSMYQHFFETELKMFYKTLEEVMKSYAYYEKEEIEKYGCVAITIQKTN